MIKMNALKHVHLIGIGGIGMSAIAQILIKKDIHVSGSDIRTSNITRKLENAGAEIHYTHSSSNITDAIDLVVYTSAVNNDNAELLQANALNIQLMSRSEMYGLIMQDYSTAIAISGAHGKTTTTSMTSVIFNATDLDPTLLVGAEVPEIEGNAKIGKGDIFITEACEYKENFLDFIYTTAVILNIDEDHLDYFDNLDHIVSAFTKFANQLPKNGQLIINNDDFNTRKILSHLEVKNIISYGINTDSDYNATNITYNDLGCPKYEVVANGKILGKIELSIPGRHNIYNSLASIVIAHNFGIDFELIKKSLKFFKGAHRRFEYKGDYNGAKIIDDYAHHPSEIKATLEAAQKIQDRKIIVAFQPHTYTRTRQLLNEFSSAFDLADEVIILDIYAAREVDDGSIHSKTLVERIAARDVKVCYMETFEHVAEYLSTRLNSEDIFFTMGAGDIYKITELLLKD
jgi:UDP-N-acetylmuramate--alanine ligase